MIKKINFAFHLFIALVLSSLSTNCGATALYDAIKNVLDYNVLSTPHLHYRASKQQRQRAINSNKRKRKGLIETIHRLVEQDEKLTSQEISRDELLFRVLEYAQKKENEDVLDDFALYLFREKILDPTIESPRWNYAVMNLISPKSTNDQLFDAVVDAYPDMLSREQNNDGETLLHIAAKLNQPDSVKRLLERGADASAQDARGRTPLASYFSELTMNANRTFNHELFNTLLSHSDPRHTYNNRHILYYAGEADDPHQMITDILKRVEELGDNPETFISTAKTGTMYGEMAIMKRAVMFPHSKNNPSEEGQRSYLRALVEHGADVHVLTGNNENLLHIAAGSEHINPTTKTIIVDELNKLLHGETFSNMINAKNRNGRTPLDELHHLQQKYPPQASLLNEPIETLKSLGALPGSQVKSQPIEEPIDPTRVFALVRRRKTTEEDQELNSYFGRLKSAGQLTQLRDRERWTLLHRAALHGDVESVDKLLDAGADILKEVTTLSAPGKSFSPLHLAVLADEPGHRASRSPEQAREHKEKKRAVFERITQHLREQMGESGLANYINEHNILHRAAQEKHATIVQDLLDLGADPNKTVTVQKSGWSGETTHVDTPLSMAITTGSPKVVKVLLEGGADASTQVAPAARFGVSDTISVKEYVDQAPDLDENIRTELNEMLAQPTPRKPSPGKVGGPTPRPQPKPTLRGTGTPTGPTPQPITNGNGDGPGGPPSGDDDEWSPTKKAVIYGGVTLTAATAAALIYRWWKKRKKKLQLGKPKQKPLGPMDGPEMPDANWGV